MPNDPSASLREEIKRLMEEEAARNRRAANCKILDSLRASDWGRAYLEVRFPQYVNPLNDDTEEMGVSWIDADLHHMADLLRDIESRGRPDKFREIYERLERRNPEKLWGFLETLSRSRYYYILSVYHKDTVKKKLNEWKAWKRKVEIITNTLLKKLKNLLSDEDYIRLSEILITFIRFGMNACKFGKMIDDLIAAGIVRRVLDSFEMSKAKPEYELVRSVSNFLLGLRHWNKLELARHLRDHLFPALGLPVLDGIKKDTLRKQIPHGEPFGQIPPKPTTYYFIEI